MGSHDTLDMQASKAGSSYGNGWKARLACVCRQGVQDGKAPVRCWGPMFQGEYLRNLGIAARLETLLDAASTATEREELYRGAMRLVAGPQPYQSCPLDANVMCKEPSNGAGKMSGHNFYARMADDGEHHHTLLTQNDHDKDQATKHQERDQEGIIGEVNSHDGLGMQYMVMAISPSNQAPPFPFDN